MDYLLFSCDDHVDLDYLPPDLWTSRVPAAYRDSAPRQITTPEGRRWVADGPPSRALVPRPVGIRGIMLEHEEGRWRPTTPELRLEDMDRDGVEAQVLYGSATFGFEVRDPELLTVSMRAYNDWMADFCRASPRRLIGLGRLPVHDPSAAVDELRRCAGLGLRGVHFQAFEAYRYPWDAVWEPLWSAAAETGTPISFHVGGGHWSLPPAAETPPGRGVGAMNRACLTAQLDEVLCSLILSGALARHPAFKAVLGESSIGWIPFLLERMDRKYRETHAGSLKRDDTAPLDLLPSEYWKRQIYGTFQEDPVGIRLLDLLGADNVMWGSDYPHTDSIWPDSQATVEAMFKDVPPAITRKVVRDNGMRLYR